MRALCLVLLLSLARLNSAWFNFSHAHGNHMVLQAAPHRATLWGFGNTPNTKVTVWSTAWSGNVTGVVDPKTLTWFVELPAVAATFLPHVINATEQGTGSSIGLEDVLFGDVWVCSGQSNMVMAVGGAFNATQEGKIADNYPNIRVLTVSLIASETPLVDFAGITQPWSKASAQEIAGGGSWAYFSATCWFYGRNVYDGLSSKRPLGLITTAWGGTYIQAWSSPDALKKCPNEGDAVAVQHWSEPKVKQGAGPNPNTPSVLWNAMVVPLLKTTIKGAVWYQGEANAGADAANYACQFPAMISDWRAKWRQINGQSDPTFPFGFVQLSTWNDNSTDTVGAVPILRWSQTASNGFVPNNAMPNTFMAITTDLGDPHSPLGDIHPRDKQRVGYRLAQGGLNVAYGEKVYWQGPLVQSLTQSSPTSNVHVALRNLGPNGLTLQHAGGFEVCATGDCTVTSQNSTWEPATLTNAAANGFDVKGPRQATWKAVRYNWHQAPCTPEEGELLCAVYSDGFPLGPFLLPVTHA